MPSFQNWRCAASQTILDFAAIPSHSGLGRLRREDYRWKYVLVRKSRYLNNVVEQDHRAIKGRCQPMLGFKSYKTAAVTLAGLELVHRIRGSGASWGSLVRFGLPKGGSE